MTTEREKKHSGLTLSFRIRCFNSPNAPFGDHQITHTSDVRDLLQTRGVTGMRTSKNAPCREILVYTNIQQAS